MARPFAFNDPGEVLLIDKPKSWTSFDVVAKVRNTSRAKVGHAGTLDPMATGLLILCTGRMTKQIEAIQNADKTYIAEIQLGATTPSYDAESDPEPQASWQHIKLETIQQAIEQNFVGLISQVPPAYSAIKIKGTRAYKLARKGKEVALKPRHVSIHSFKLTQYDAAAGKLTANIHCSKGTYIRSLAHDLGQVLGVGGYLTGLIRTSIGKHQLAAAWQLPQLIEAIKAYRQGLPPA